MDWIKNNITNPASIGAATALGGGLIKYFIGTNLGVEANAKSMGKIFILVTAAGLLVGEVNAEKRKIEN